MRPTSIVWRRLPYLLMVLWVVYAAVFIWKTSFVIDGQRYFSLFDDPMISMRYAKNLAEGAGPVWTPGGERVEGFSNPLWVGVMALVHLLPLAPAYTSLAVQVLSAGLLLANLVLVKGIADDASGRNVLVASVAVGLTGFYYPLNNWGLFGNDVAPAVTMVSLAVWLGYRQLRTEAFSAWVYLVLGLATLVRFDLLVVYLVVWVYLAWADSRFRRQHLAWGGGILAAFTLGQTLARVSYYGDLLPNPYYLKMTGGPVLLRLVRGAFIFVKFVWNFNPIVFLLPFVVLPLRWERRLWLPVAVFAWYAAYSVYVGGDAWEHRGGANRFVATVMPLFFVLLAQSLEVLRDSLVGNPPLSARAAGASIVAAGALAIVSLLNANALIDTSSLRAAFLLERPIYAVGNERNTTLGLFLRRITDEQARIAYVAAGAAPYFAGRQAIDLLGKSDRVVARGPMHLPPDLALIDYRPGHMKWDYAYSIGELQPDVVVEIWQGMNPEAAAALAGYLEIRVPELERWLPDGRMYLRTGSSHLRWEVVAPYAFADRMNGQGAGELDP